MQYKSGVRNYYALWCKCRVWNRVGKWALITREFSFSFSKFERFWGWSQGFQNFWGFFEAEGDVKFLRVLRIYPQKPSHFEVRMRARLLRFFEEFSKILEKWCKKALKRAYCPHSRLKVWESIEGYFQKFSDFKARMRVVFLRTFPTCYQLVDQLGWRWHLSLDECTARSCSGRIRQQSSFPFWIKVLQTLWACDDGLNHVHWGRVSFVPYKGVLLL